MTLGTPDVTVGSARGTPDLTADEVLTDAILGTSTPAAAAEAGDGVPDEAIPTGVTPAAGDTWTSTTSGVTYTYDATYGWVPDAPADGDFYVDAGVGVYNYLAAQGGWVGPSPMEVVYRVGGFTGPPYTPIVDLNATGKDLPRTLGSDSGYNATAAPGSRPAVVPASSIYGINDGTSEGTPTPPPNTAGGGFTALVVARANVSGINTFLQAGGGQTGGLQWRTNGTNHQIMRSGVAVDGTIAGFTYSVWHLLVLTYDNDSNAITIRQDRAQLGQVTGSGTAFSQENDFVIGAYGTGGGETLNGFIAEVQWAPSVLTVPQIEAIEAQVSAYYGNEW